MDPVTVVKGKVSVLDRADIDTDQIIPKQFLKRIERTGYGEFLFYDWVRSGEVSLEPNPILVAGRNFGCGSSREHAVWAIQQFGFGAVVAPSFSDIFFGNCTKNGLLPIRLAEADVRALAAAGEATIDLAQQTISFAGRTLPFEIDAEIKHRLLNGLDEIALTLEHVHDIDAFERDRLPAGPVTTAL
ncbi:MAG TPA: 3-isopropylmalate dehydratase small subunit [Actinomycetota bacterium]|nr:3-isopropylmalate dehydratase small subunit [Actinomycetota bacterium]